MRVPALRVSMLFAAGLLAAAAPQAAGPPEAELARLTKAWFGKNFAADWRTIEKLPGMKWAPLPPKSLDNCLPDGGCYTRQGQVRLGGLTLGVLATGARGFTGNLYLRNTGQPIGEAAVLAALKQAGMNATLARCPAPGTRGGTHWYKLAGSGTRAGVFAVQSQCNGKPCEGFVLTMDDTLPPLAPQQQKLYTEQCPAAR